MIQTFSSLNIARSACQIFNFGRKKKEEKGRGGEGWGFTCNALSYRA